MMTVTKDESIVTDLEKTFGKVPHLVMIAGTFDIIHPGHINYISTAAQYGEVIAIVACDNEVMKIKKHETVMNELMRQTVVQSIKGVKQAILGNKNGEWYEPILKYKPHLFLMGFNQPGDPVKFESIIKEKGGKTLFRRMKEPETEFSLSSSTQIKEKVCELQDN